MRDHQVSLLLCYDGSDHAKFAIAEAARLFPNAAGTVLHVWEPIENVLLHRGGTLGYVTDMDITAVDREARERSAALMAEGMALALQHGLEAQERSIPVWEHVWSTILDAADELDADIIVTGSRGLSGVRELTLGSLSHRLLQHSSRPVLAIPSPQLAEARRAERGASAAQTTGAADLTLVPSGS